MVPVDASYSMSFTLMQSTPLSGNETLGVFFAGATSGLMKTTFTVKLVRIDGSGSVRRGQKKLNWEWCLYPQRGGKSRQDQALNGSRFDSCA